ncbi:MAG: peptide-methionine (R)-S-oxide reductase MsrB [Pseudomonadota bacterium]
MDKVNKLGSLTRRAALAAGASALALPAVAGAQRGLEEENDTMTPAPVPLGESDVDWDAVTEDQWRDRLTGSEFRILRREGTEWAGSSSLNDEKRPGVFICAGCALPLFRSETKYDSGTGWPSFFDYIEGALDFKTDYKLIYPRKEYHCVRCNGHQGHVFRDGPQPTGLRYCNNGVALNFVPDAA